MPCRSKLARGMLLRRCITTLSSGLLAWLLTLWLCIGCFFQMWGYNKSLHRYVRGRARARSCGWRGGELEGAPNYSATCSGDMLCSLPPNSDICFRPSTPLRIPRLLAMGTVPPLPLPSILKPLPDLNPKP